MQSDAELIVERWGKLKGARGNYEATWQEIAEYTRPLRNEFLGSTTAGAKRNQKIFDSTALTSVDNFGGGIYGMMTNPANRWLAVRVADEDMNDYDPVRDWLYEVDTRILNSFGPQVSNFYSQLPAYYCDLVSFGTAPFYTEADVGSNGFNDSCRSLSECCIAENDRGNVDTTYRRFTLEARNAVSKFGEQNLSRETLTKADKTPYEPVAFIHCVDPNPEARSGMMGARFKAFRSIYVEEHTRTEAARAGYEEMPYHVARWSQAAGEVYGRGIGEVVIADVRTINQQSATSLRAAQKIADPPLGAPDEGVIKNARTYPGGISYGAVDATTGQLLLRPIVSGGRLDITLEMMEQRRSAIKEGYYFSLMQMIGSPNMTATEWMGRQEEKLRLMGPNLGRIQSEFLSPLVKRRFGMLYRAGMLPAPPEEIQGQKLTIEYVSPLARAMMAGEAQAVNRLYQSVAGMAQMDPSVLDNLDHDEAVKVLGRGWAVPAKVLRGKDQVDQLRQQRQKQQQMQQGLAAAQMAAGAAKDAGSALASGAQAEQNTTPDQAAILQKSVGQLANVARQQAAA